jgi:hypothetical protein
MSQSGPIIGSWKRNVPMLLLAVAGLASPLWAADPLIGTWKLNVAKSNYWALQQANVKEVTGVYRELKDGQIEVTATGTRTDGSPF